MSSTPITPTPEPDPPTRHKADDAPPDVLDQSVLESLGKAITTPVRDAATPAEDTLPDLPR